MPVTKESRQPSLKRLLAFIFLITFISNLNFPLKALGQAPAISQDSPFESLKVISRNSLNQNIVQLKSGPYLRAGANQFGALWTRDFCFSIPGLIAINRLDVVKNHLTALILSQRNDGLVPRVLSSFNNKLAVLRHTIGRKLPLPYNPTLEDPLLPEYIGEHGTFAIDSNSLVLLGSLTYLKASGDMAWWNEMESKLVSIYRFYDQYIERDLVQQVPYSDWQDSVKRVGATFFGTFLYWKTSHLLRNNPKFEITSQKTDAIRFALDKTFLDPQTGLYFATEEKNNFSIDGILLAIETPDFFNHLEDRTLLFNNLIKHPLWLGKNLQNSNDNLPIQYSGPGFASYPDYDPKNVSTFVKIAGMRHYHDSMYWSWLVAHAALAAKMIQQDSLANTILKNFQQIAIRDGVIYEVYLPCKQKKPLLAGVPLLSLRLCTGLTSRFTSRLHDLFSFGLGCLCIARQSQPRSHSQQQF
jgi:hypothetical protein